MNIPFRLIGFLLTYFGALIALHFGFKLLMEYLKMNRKRLRRKVRRIRAEIGAAQWDKEL